VPDFREVVANLFTQDNTRRVKRKRDGQSKRNNR